MKKQIIFRTTFNQYVTSEILGEGGAGRVYKVADTSDQFYALKLLDPNKANKERRRRFKNELFFCLKNQHSNILTVIDHGILVDESSGSPFYVMPLFSSSLRKLITDGIPSGKALHYFSQLLDGVEAAHLKGVIHRDLKPENVLFEQKEERLVVADFGIAQFQEEELHTAVETKPNTRLANFQYAAPEQRARGLAVDHRSDIYSLGLILNEIFTGEVPWGTGYNNIESVSSEHKYLDEIVSSMIRQSPQDRPESIEVVKQQLIGNKQKQITQQRLSKLKETVVPVSDLDDPLILDPPRIVNFDYDQGMLTLFFQQPVNEIWKWALVNMGSHTSVGNKGPTSFHISGNKASVSASEDQVQRIIDYFKSWLPKANRKYEMQIRREKKEAEEKQRQQLQQQIEEQERRDRILKNVKI